MYDLLVSITSALVANTQTGEATPPQDRSLPCPLGKLTKRVSHLSNANFSSFASCT